LHCRKVFLFCSFNAGVQEERAYMKKSRLYPVCLLIAVFLIVGCDNAKRPDGLPKLYPCSILVQQDGQPLEKAQVMLVQQDNAGTRWVVGGITGSDGIVQVSTYGQYPGAPLGEYKVTVTKNEQVMVVQPSAMGPGRFDTYTLVEREFTQEDTTPLLLHIVQGTKKYQIDVGKPVREKTVSM